MNSFPRRVRLIPLLVLAISIAFGQARAAAASPAPSPITLTDAAGRPVTFPDLPRRIVVVGKGSHIALHVLYFFPEAKTRLAGTEKWSDLASSFLPLIDPDFPNVPMMVPNPGAEEIAALRPDLVLTRGTEADWLSESMGKIGIPVFYLGLESWSQYERDIANLGILLGNEPRAREVAAYYRSRLDRVQKATAGLSAAAKPRVLTVLWMERGGKAAVQVAPATWMQTYQTEFGGGTPVWLDAAAGSGGWTIINLEQIAAWDPDQIYIIIWYSLDPVKIMDSIRADSRWSALKAVKSGRLRAYPADIYGWDSPDPRWILGVMWLASSIHPELFRDLDMTAEIEEFYVRLYGMDRKTVADIILPAIKMDLR